jgi:hypothetical protein
MNTGISVKIGNLSKKKTVQATLRTTIQLYNPTVPRHPHDHPRGGS